MYKRQGIRQPIVSNTSTRREAPSPAQTRNRSSVPSRNTIDSGTLPPVPAPRRPVPTASSERSRSDYRNREPRESSRSGTAASASSGSTELPKGWKHVSGKIPGVTPKRTASPSRRYGGASASTDPAPGHAPDPTPGPLLPTDDVDGVDVPVPDSDVDSDASTIEYDGYHVDTGRQAYFRKEPPTPYRGWSQNQGMESVVESQLAYLASYSVAEGPYSMYWGTSEEECFEMEFSPLMSKFLDDPLVVQDDEVLVIYVTKSNKSKRMVKKNLDNLSAQDVRDNWPEVLIAIRKEIKSFYDMKTFEIVLRHEAENICSSRWVFKFKLVDGVKVVKARLTVRGFEDLAANLNTFASTASRWGQRLVLSVAVQRKWRLFTWDVSTNFLQVLTFKELAAMSNSELRQVAFTPPAGSEQYFKELPNCERYDPMKHVLNMVKPVYGLKDAPKSWKINLDLIIRSTGGVPLHTDASLYLWFVQGLLQMMLSSHVDDLKGCGEAGLVTKVMKELERQFGKLKVAELNFEHCGILHVQSPELTEIQIHQNHYVLQLQPIDLLSVAQWPQDKLLSTSLLADFLSLLGALSWLIQTRLDIAVYVCALQRKAKAPAIEHAKRCNKVLKWVRRKNAAITYKHMQGPCRILAISDSAFRKECNAGLAMRGAIIGISSDAANSLSGFLHIVEFYARKQRRVCRSTYSAELNAASDAYEFAKLVAMTLAEVIAPCPSAKLLTTMEESGTLPVCVHLIIDALSVYDSLASEEIHLPTESSLVMMLHQLKEALLTHTLRCLHWCDTKDMVSDGLNKGACSREALLSLGNTGYWHLVHQIKSFCETRHVPIPSIKAVISEIDSET